MTDIDDNAVLCPCGRWANNNWGTREHPLCACECGKWWAIPDGKPVLVYEYTDYKPVQSVTTKLKRFIVHLPNGEDWKVSYPDAESAALCFTGVPGLGGLTLDDITVEELPDIEEEMPRISDDQNHA